MKGRRRLLVGVTVVMGLGRGTALAQDLTLAKPPEAASTGTLPSDEPGAAPKVPPPDAPEASKAPPEAPSTESASDERLEALERRLTTVERENQELRDEVDTLREDQDWNATRVEQLMPLTTRVAGYVDVGFFYVQGDGSGIERDFGNAHFPEYANVGPWVFMGDPLSTAINSRGDPADTGGARAVTLNPIDSNGKSSFIVNNVNLAVATSITPEVTVLGLVDFLPRSRNVSDSSPHQNGLGDFIDVKLAHIAYSPTIKDVNLTVWAGKVDSILGWEYRAQEAPARLTVTPSLLCRYTCGRPVGLRATAGFFDDRLEVGAALTNGSHSIEGFPLYDETDTNQTKTMAGRVVYRVDVGAGLEVGVSGAWGAQDFQPNDGVLQRHIGGHAHLDVGGLEATVEYGRGDAQGETGPEDPNTPVVACNRAPCIDYQAAYALVGYRVNNWLVPYARTDWRDALHRSGMEFVYVSKLLRATPGVRIEFSRAFAAKVEYTFNRELERIPEFPNDVFTSSLIGRF